MIFTVFDNSSCDILAIEEPWYFYSNTSCLGTIHINYMFTLLSGVDSGNKILSGGPHGGVVFVYKKRVCNKIKLIKSINRRVCWIQMNCSSEYSC